MYAVIFYIDSNHLETIEPTTLSTNVYNDIRKFMEANGFTWVQENIYFGDESINAINCVMCVQNLAKQFPWFAACAKDVQMLRVEETNDLMPALESVQERKDDE
jgi:virulence-associated protein VapD